MREKRRMASSALRTRIEPCRTDQAGPADTFEGTSVKIAICGISIESSTFTKHITTLVDFDVRRGPEIVARHPLQDWAPDVEFFGTLTAHSQPAGPIEPDVYDALENEMADRLQALGPMDGVWLDMHGAMNVLGRDRAEEHWIRRVRDVVGADTVVSGSFDPHGNISRELAGLVDLAAFHRHSPHIDNAATRERAVRNLVEVLHRGKKPAKAWVRIPALLPGERTSTVVDPGRSVFGAQLPTIEKYQLLDAAVCVGFFWADEPRNAAAVLTTAWDSSASVTAAEELAHGFWERHQEFQIVSDHYGDWDQALEFALARPYRPLYISDSGDNVTAGGTGDITHALERTIAHPAVLESGLRFLFAGMWDPETLAAAGDAEVGGVLDRAIGARYDDRYGQPVAGPWQVERLTTDPDGQAVEALLRNDNVDVIVRADRKAFIGPDDQASGGGIVPDLIDTGPYDAVVVKNGYLFPSQADNAGAGFIALTPGGTDLEHDRLDYHRLSRPLYPWDNPDSPDLRAQIIPPWTTPSANR
jgi:microcystin degradation protein MlrC